MGRRVDRKQIPGHDDYYADRKGNIWRRHNGRLIRVNPVTHCTGYQYTNVRGKKYLTQRLVCAAFKGENPLYKPICIRSAKRQQPRRIRSQRFLRWGLRSEVNRRNCCRRRLGPSDVKQIRRLRSNGMTQIRLAEKFGVTQCCISLIVNNKIHFTEEGCDV